MVQNYRAFTLGFLLLLGYVAAQTTETLTTLAPVGPTLSLDLCSPNPCDNGGICLSNGVNATCDCEKTGFTGPDCTVDINECERDQISCGAGMFCDNVPGSYACNECTCTPGWASSDVSATKCTGQTAPCLPCEAGVICAGGSSQETLIQCPLNASPDQDSICQCKQGYVGSEWDATTQEYSSCELVKCASSSAGQAPACSECADGYVGPSTWDARQGSWSECEVVACPVNADYHPDCRCLTGYRADPPLTWLQTEWSGACIKLECPENTVASSWPVCFCQEGYVGSYIWSASQAEFLGSCERVECPVHSSGHPDCACERGYRQETSVGFTWTGETWEGDACVQARCPPNAQADGEGGCHCKPYYYESSPISWDTYEQKWEGLCESRACPATTLVVPSTGDQSPCICQDGFSGTMSWDPQEENWTPSCIQAACPANAFGAPDCACDRGYLADTLVTGSGLTWSRATQEWVGACKAVPCEVISYSSGFPDCACLAGFIGQPAITWDEERGWTGYCQDVNCPEFGVRGVSLGECVCDVGFEGTLVAESGGFSGSCAPVACPDFASGSPCACERGYSGSITWDSDLQEWSGTCVEVSCPLRATSVPSSSTFSSALGCACDVGYASGSDSRTNLLSWDSDAQEWNGPCQAVDCPPTTEALGDGSLGCVCVAGSLGTVEWNADLFIWEASCEDVDECLSAQTCNDAVCVNQDVLTTGSRFACGLVPVDGTLSGASAIEDIAEVNEVTFEVQGTMFEVEAVWFGPPWSPRKYRCADPTINGAEVKCTLTPFVGTSLTIIVESCLKDGPDGACSVYDRQSFNREEERNLFDAPLPVLVPDTLLFYQPRTPPSAELTITSEMWNKNPFRAVAFSAQNVLFNEDVIVTYGLDGQYTCELLSNTNTDLIVCLLSSLSYGQGWTFSVNAGGQLAQGTDQINFPTAAEITSVSGCAVDLDGSTSDCPTEGGITLTLQGSGFSFPAVSVGDKFCPLVQGAELNETYLECQLPGGTGVDMPLSVASSGVPGPSFRLLSYAAPVVSKISSRPCQSSGALELIGCPRTGFMLTIEGENFGRSDALVYLGLYLEDACSDVVHDVNQPHQRLSCFVSSGVLLNSRLEVSHSGGTPSSELTGKISSAMCPKGSVWVREYSSCAACSVGRYTPTAVLAGQQYEQSCQDCPPGTFQPAAGQTECTPCPAGEYNQAQRQTECLQCAPGTYSSAGQYSCFDCPSGTYSAVPGSEVCSACPEGTVQPAVGQTNCTKCDPGEEPTPGGTSCRPCPENWISNAETGKCTPCFGDLTSTDRVTCDCPAGTYGVGNGTEVSCMECPGCGVCEAGSVWSTIRTRADCWRSQDSLNFYSCPRFQCDGNSALEAGNPGCAAHRTGPLCSFCEESYHASQSDCIKCPSRGSASTQAGLMFAAMVVAFFVLVYFLLRTERQALTDRKLQSTNSAEEAALKKEADIRMKLKQHVFQGIDPSTATVVGSVFFISLMKISIGFFQVLNSLTAVVDTPMPRLFVDVSSYLRVLDLDFIPWGMLDCLYQLDFYQEMILAALIPPALLLLVVGVTWAVTSCQNRYDYRDDGSTRRARVSRITVFIKLSFFVIFLFYPRVSATILSFYNCIQVDGTWLLASDMTQQCFSSEWWSYLPAAITLTVIYPIGILMGVFVLVRLLKKKQILRRADIVSRYGMLYVPYRSKLAFWEVADMMYKLIQTSLLIYFHDTRSRMVATLIVCGLYLMSLTLSMPYRGNQENTLAQLAQVEILNIVLMTLTLTVGGEPLSKGMDVLLSLLLLVLSLGVMVAACVVSFKMVHNARRTLQRAKSQRSDLREDSTWQTQSMTLLFDTMPDLDQSMPGLNRSPTLMADQHTPQMSASPIQERHFILDAPGLAHLPTAPVPELYELDASQPGHRKESQSDSDGGMMLIAD